MFKIRQKTCLINQKKGLVFWSSLLEIWSKTFAMKGLMNLPKIVCVSFSFEKEILYTHSNNYCALIK